MTDSKHLSHFQHAHLRKDERVVAWAPATTTAKTGGIPRGALIVTTRRVVFCKKGWFGELVDAVELRNVTAVERSSSMGTHRVTIRASGHSIECILNWASQESAKAVLDALDERDLAQSA